MRCVPNWCLRKSTNIKKRNFGKSLRQLIDLYESIPETKEQVKFPVSDIKNITEGDLSSQKNHLERLISAGRIHRSSVSASACGSEKGTVQSASENGTGAGDAKLSVCT